MVAPTSFGDIPSAGLGGVGFDNCHILVPKQELEHTDRLPVFVVVRESQRTDDRVLIGSLLDDAGV